MQPSSKRFPFETVAFFLILALAAYLRLANQPDNPGWYTDEGTHLDIARHLLQGQTRYMAVTQSTLLFAKLPLFDLCLAGLLGIWDGGMATLRAFTGALGVLSVATLYGVVRWVRKDPALALLSASLLAIYPPAVVYSRLGFSYNLLTPLVLLALAGLWGYLSAEPGSPVCRHGLALASLAIGVGGVSDLWMLCMVAPLALAVSARRWRDLAWSLPLALLPLGVYAAVMLVSAPQAFWFDVRFTLSRLDKPLLEQLRVLALNYTTLVFQDGWIALGAVGLFTLRPMRLQRLSLSLFWLPIVVLGRSAALFSLGFYYVIPLLPFVTLGVAALIERGVPQVVEMAQAAGLPLVRRWGWRWLPDRLLAVTLGLVVILVLIAPFLSSAVMTAGQIGSRLSMHIDPFLINPGDARQVARFVEGRLRPGDVVVASPGLAWLLSANVADFSMSLAAAGQGTALLPANIPPDRFAFDPRFTRARFVIVDNLWRNWGVWTIAGAADALEDVEAWSRLFQAGEIEVYCNPACCK